jgi:hypothetical protein
MMRTAWVTGKVALGERLMAKSQLPAEIPESGLPAYVESFLAHLRLLIGVPFDYLVPDERLLPVESIRFFYLDRSWTDRLIDGAVQVGKIGTREQAHHQAHAPNVNASLDVTERIVRILQRGTHGFELAKKNAAQEPAGLVTGFLLRSTAVAGWPHMDVRAFNQVLEQYPVPEVADKAQLTTLRLERLAPAVLIALFDGVPELVWLEEPHHGIQFGVTRNRRGMFVVDRHTPGGWIEKPAGPQVPVPVRAANERVISVAGLRKKLVALNDPNLVQQTGSAGFAIEMLNLPWRQRFQGRGGTGSSGVFVPHTAIAARVQSPALKLEVERLVR